MRERPLKIKSLTLLVVLLLATSHLTVASAKASDAFKLTPTDNHHFIELNSNQPYVAGFHVNTPDLETREPVFATAITVSFASAETSYFPSSSWLGGGMFVQAQDNQIRHVDYAFYTMLVLDSEGNFFLDLGMYQTREATIPFHTPLEQLVYARTWQISGIAPEMAFTLSARWDSEGWVHYSAYAAGFNSTLPPIDVVSFPDCEFMIRRFYAGNVVVGPFPFSRYVQYFQFGVVSSTSIANNHWSVSLTDPQILRKTGWALVDTAWSIEGDVSYLDNSWVWGGAPYHGVSAQYYRNPLEKPYEVIFFYNGQTLPSGTILWETSTLNPRVEEAKSSIGPILTYKAFYSYALSSLAWLLILVVAITELRLLNWFRRVSQKLRTVHTCKLENS